MLLDPDRAKDGCLYRIHERLTRPMKTLVDLSENVAWEDGTGHKIKVLVTEKGKS